MTIEFMKPYLDFTLFNNTGEQYFNAIVVFFTLFIVLRVFKTVILIRLKQLAKKTENKIDDVIIKSIDSVHWPFFFIVAVFFGIRFLTLSVTFERWYGYFILIASVYYAVKTLNSIITVFTSQIMEKRKKEDKASETPAIYLMTTILKMAMWVFGLLFLLSNFGINITSLIAGLGIGGIAIALALQNVLTDMFSSFSIYFDKPFQVGEFIIIGEFMGTVKHIGIKSTRIQSLSGEEIVMSNRELTSTTVKNYKRMKRRRIVFAFGVVYQTTSKKLDKIPTMVRGIIEKVEDATPDRIHFKAFGASSLDFEVVYYMEVSDYGKYMDAQQQINLEMVKAFEKEKIEFAYPTQTLYVNKLK